MKKSLVLTLAICLLTSSCQRKIQADLSSSLTEGEIIEAIDVRGHIQITIDTMRQGLHSRAGGRIRLPVIKSDIEFLYSLGFEEVRVDEESARIGKIVVFQVKEKTQPQKQIHKSSWY
jgi:outer membrane protein assembly factor BamA